MKNLKIVAFLILFLNACTQDKKPLSAPDAKSSKPSVDKQKESLDTPLLDIPWSAVSDSSGNNFTMKRTSVNDSITLTPDNVLKSINNRYPDVQAIYERSNQDTILIKIPNATYLTQQIGTSGAQMYFAESTYSLTEIKDVKYVKFIFKEGDHASPRTFSRKSFEKK